jgi:hypothetical protein
MEKIRKIDKDIDVFTKSSPTKITINKTTSEKIISPLPITLVVKFSTPRVIE